jgi:hypothetical protein
MKLLCCAALLFAAYSHAGELLPLAEGDDTERVQKSLDEFLRPVVTSADGVKVQPIIEEMRIAGRAKRIFLGPLARNSFITMRVRITDSGTSTEEVFSEESSAWKGTFRPGVDYDMLDAIAERAAEFVARYLSGKANMHPLADVIGQE